MEMARVEQQLLEFREAMDAGERSAVKLREANVQLAAAAASARLEATSAAESASRLNSTVQRLREELGELKEEHTALTVGVAGSGGGQEGNKEG